MRTLLVMVVAVASAGCAAKQQKLFRASPVHIESPAAGDSACVERLLVRSRMLGYVEQTVDKEMGFFRVQARNKKQRTTPRPTSVEFYNVQCTGETSAIITAVNEDGAMSHSTPMDEQQREEFDDFAHPETGLPTQSTTRPPSAYRGACGPPRSKRIAPQSGQSTTCRTS